MIATDTWAISHPSRLENLVELFSRYGGVAAFIVTLVGIIYLVV